MSPSSPTHNYNLHAIAHARFARLHSFVQYKAFDTARNGGRYSAVHYFMNSDKTRTYLSGPGNEARWLSGKAREDIFLHVPLPFLSD